MTAFRSSTRRALLFVCNGFSWASLIADLPGSRFSATTIVTKASFLVRPLVCSWRNTALVWVSLALSGLFIQSLWFLKFGLGLARSHCRSRGPLPGSFVEPPLRGTRLCPQPHNRIPSSKIQVLRAMPRFVFPVSLNVGIPSTSWSTRMDTLHQNHPDCSSVARNVPTPNNIAHSRIEVDGEKAFWPQPFNSSCRFCESEHSVL